MFPTIYIHRRTRQQKNGDEKEREPGEVSRKISADQRKDLRVGVCLHWQRANSVPDVREGSVQLSPECRAPTWSLSLLGSQGEGSDNLRVAQRRRRSHALPYLD